MLSLTIAFRFARFAHCGHFKSRVRQLSVMNASPEHFNSIPPEQPQENSNQQDEQSKPSESRKLTPYLATKRREKPPMRYTDDFETPTQVTLDTIGVVRSPYKERFGTPRQPNVTTNTLGNQMQPATIQLYKSCKYELALRGLAQFEYCWVITYFHLNQGFNPLVTPPRGPRKKQGVFATRSPHRPNSIGLSCIRITGVDEKKGLIHLLGVDLLDGTPVLDVKPYVPYCDSFPNAKSGWLDTLREDMKAPDALGYYPPPAHLTQQFASSKNNESLTTSPNINPDNEGAPTNELGESNKTQ